MLGRSRGAYWLRTWILEPDCLAQVPGQPLACYVTSDKLFNIAGPRSTDLHNGDKAVTVSLVCHEG